MPDDLAALIRDRRQQLGLTQAQLAERIGRAPSTIGSWETGRSRPADEATVEALVRVLDLDAVDAVDRVPPHPVRPAPEPPPQPTRPPPPAPEPPTRPTARAPETDSATASSEPAEPAPVRTEMVVTEVREVAPVLPVRTDTDPVYRIRVVATVVAVVVLGWVFVVSIEAAAEILGSITEAMLAPFRA